MAVLISAQTTAATSADFTVGATPVTISVIAPNTAILSRLQTFVDLKDSNGIYHKVHIVYGHKPEILAAAGTYRVRKGATDLAIGVDQN